MRTTFASKTPIRRARASRTRAVVVATLFVVACSDADSSQKDRDGGSDGGAVVDANPRDAADSEATYMDAFVDSDAAPDAGDLPDASVQPEAALEDARVDVDAFTRRVIIDGLAAPWEVSYGPDRQLWITERVGKRVVRVDPSTGERRVALSLDDVYQAAGQDGLLGMALHPDLLRNANSDFVYLAYTYDADPGSGVDRRAMIARYSYDPTSQQLANPSTLIAGLPASTDHNSGRLVFGPDERLYYTIGDQGHNQFDNKCLPIHAQDLPTPSQIAANDWSAYQGKILRLSLDGAIPTDNPVIGGVQSHVFSYGHRNAQGLAFAPDGRLYASEQGPKTDDELNLIAAGNNYGWPFVAGYRDDQAYVYRNWSAATPTPCAELDFTDYEPPADVPSARESDWPNDFTAPLLTFYTVQNGFNFMDPACAGNEFICWPTIAPSSLAYFTASGPLASWGSSLLVPSLKRGSVFRAQLSADPSHVEGMAEPLFTTTNRYRDLALGDDGRTFYIVTDSEGTTSGPTQGSTMALENRGALLEFRYTP